MSSSDNTVIKQSTISVIQRVIKKLLSCSGKCSAVLCNKTVCEDLRVCLVHEKVPRLSSKYHSCLPGNGNEFVSDLATPTFFTRLNRKWPPDLTN